MPATPHPVTRSDYLKRSLYRLAAVALMTSMLLSACGGGGEARIPVNFIIAVLIGNQPYGNLTVAPGQSNNLAIHAGQSLKLDAGELVNWTMLVGGVEVSTGVPVYYAGANITATRVSPYAVVLDTDARYHLPAAIAVTLVATSTEDAFQVATVNVLVTD